MTTDYQIKKELEYEIHKCEDNDIPYAYISRKLLENAFNLIERQRAEIEKLKKYIYRCKSGEEYWVKCLLERPNEAVKEFAERLHEYIGGVKERHEIPMLPFSEALVMGMERKIYNLVKEMVGDTE